MKKEIIDLVASIRPLEQGEYIEHPAEETVDWIRQELMKLLSEDDLRGAAQVVYMDNNLHVGICSIRHVGASLDAAPTYEQAVDAIKGIGSLVMAVQWLDSTCSRMEAHFDITSDGTVISGGPLHGWSSFSEDDKRSRAARKLSLSRAAMAEK